MTGKKVKPTKCACGHAEINHRVFGDNLNMRCIVCDCSSFRKQEAREKIDCEDCIHDTTYPNPCSDCKDKSLFQLRKEGEK